MPLQETSGAASYDAFGGGVAAVPKYIEDYFSTFLYSGTGSGVSQTITNGIDLSTKGGLVWIKDRNSTTSGHGLWDTIRGAYKFLVSSSTGSQVDASGSGFQYGVGSFNTNGFTLPTPNQDYWNASGTNYVSWSIAKAPKFFDVVTYTGTGSVQNIAHNLGSTPGCIIVKSLAYADYWVVYHSGANGGVNPEQYGFYLNDTSPQFSGSVIWNNTAPTSTQFTLGTYARNNTAGRTYVAYLFAHDAGGFGLTGTDNVISCGSYVGDSASAGKFIELGYEPQWVLQKASSASATDWHIQDVMRGAPVNNPNGKVLRPNSSVAEYDGTNAYPAATGFYATGDDNNSGTTYIYIAIRRGPMKVPTDATKVFAPAYYASGLSTGTKSVTNFPVDMQIARYTDFASSNSWVADRLRGVSSNGTASGPYLMTFSTNAETTSSSLGWDNTGFLRSPNLGAFDPQVYWNFQRAPSFFDEVCYTGTGSATTVTHNLGVEPELMIAKARTSGTAGWWVVYHKDLGYQYYGRLESTVAFDPYQYVWQANPTSSVFSLGVSAVGNGSGVNFVWYGFATCAGVSKVGSYTGTGTTLQVDCGFAAGARFVLIKRTDSTGSWYVWDVARGISSGNDPYLLLNSTAAEVTNTDYIDAYSAGFEISSTAPAEINASGGTFIYLSIA